MSPQMILALEALDAYWERCRIERETGGVGGSESGLEMVLGRDVLGTGLETADVPSSPMPPVR
jgi:hypothetical protein